MNNNYRTNNVRQEDGRMIDQEKIRKRNDLQRQKVALNQNLADLYKKYQVACERYGQEHFSAQIQLTFIELVCQIIQLNETVESLGKVMETLDQSFGLMTETMSFIDDIMTVKYTGNNMRSRHEMNKRVKQFTKSFNSRIDSVMTVIGVIPALTKGLGNSMKKLTKAMSGNLGMAGMGGGGSVGGGSASAGLSGSARGILGSMGVLDENDYTSPSGGGAPAQGGGGSSDSSSGGPDFGEDIL